MKKMIFAVAGALLIGAGAYLNLQMSKTNVQPEDLTLANLNASTGLLDDLVDWWERPDYICQPVDCFSPIFGKYKATIAVPVENGKGTEAHNWNCVEC